MAAFKQFRLLQPMKDAQGAHKVGDVISLPYESATDRMDADRLVDYGVATEVKPPRARRGGKRG